MKTGTKVLLGFVFALVIAVAIGVVGYRGITSLGEKLTEVGDQVPEEAELWKALKPELDGWKKEHEKILNVVKRKEALLAEVKTQTQLAAEGAREALTPEQISDLANNSDAIKAIDNELFEAETAARDHSLKIVGLNDEIITLNVKGADEAKKLAKSEMASSITLLCVFLGVGALGLLGLGAFISRGTGKALKALFAEAQKLSQAAVDGKLDTRGNPQAVTAEFRPIVEGLNATLDAVIGPLNVAVAYVDCIAKGDIPPKITNMYNGDFNELKNNFNQAIDAIDALAADAKLLAKAAVEGKFDIRADDTKHQGEFRAIVQDVNDCLDAVINPLNVAAEYVNRIAKGDIPPKIIDMCNGSFNEMKSNLNQAIDAINALVADAKLLAKAAVAGKFDTRADANKHQGDFRAIVQDVNDCLDSVVSPMSVAVVYVDRIAKGDIPPKITDMYNGDFNEMKNNLNQAIDAINALAADAKLLAKAAGEGRFDARADATKHQGEFRAIVQDINDCLDAVIVPLNLVDEYGWKR